MPMRVCSARRPASGRCWSPADGRGADAPGSDAKHPEAFEKARDQEIWGCAGSSDPLKTPARSDLAQAELNLRYCDVISEIDGVVTRRNVNPGNNVQAGQ